MRQHASAPIRFKKLFWDGEHGSRVVYAMTELDAVDDNEITDPIELARLFVSGRSLKRGAIMQLVRDLLARIPTGDVVICKARQDNNVPLGVPNVAGYDARPPVNVRRGEAGSVFLGPEANRYYTPSEAIALAGAIARATIL